MVAFFSPPPFMKSKLPLSVELTDSGGLTTANLGAPASDRIILVMCSILTNNNALQTGMTIGGVTATRAGASLGTQANIAAFYALVPTGNAGALTFAGGGSPITRLVGVYRITGWRGPAPLGVVFPAGGASAGRSIEVPSASGAAAIAVSAGDSGGSNFSAIERLYNIADGQGLIHSGGRAYNVATPSVTISNSNNRVFGGLTWV